MIRKNLKFIIPIVAIFVATIIIGFLDGRFGHTLGRQPLHWVGGISVALLIGFIWNECVRNKWIQPVGAKVYWFAPILLVPLIVFLREAFDAGKGPWLKSYADLINWGLGAALGQWARYRLCERDFQKRKEYCENRLQGN